MQLIVVDFGSILAFLFFQFEYFLEDLQGLIMGFLRVNVWLADCIFSSVLAESQKGPSHHAIFRKADNHIAVETFILQSQFFKGQI